jgi:hypothetical protein
VVAAVIRRVVVVAALVVLAPGCGTCSKSKPPPEPAGRRELELVDQALAPGGGKYQAALLELEKDRAAALRAVREQSAPPHTREAVLLAMMTDRLSSGARYQAWQQTLDRSVGTGGAGSQGGLFGSGAPRDATSILGPQYPERVPGLDEPAQVYFWAERLLVVGGDTAELAAVPHLERLGNAAAIDALAVYARTPGSGIAAFDAARALGRLGRGRELADALAAYQNPPIPPTAIPGGVATIKAGFATLPAAARTRTENELLTALEQEPLSDDQRAGYVAAIGEIGSARAVDRLAALRRTPWGEQHKPELDAATAAILDREEP